MAAPGPMIMTPATGTITVSSDAAVERLDAYLAEARQLWEAGRIQAWTVASKPSDYYVNEMARIVARRRAAEQAEAAVAEERAVQPAPSPGYRAIDVD